MAQDADAHDLQDVSDLVGTQARQLVEGGLAVAVGEHPVEEDGVEVRIEPQVGGPVGFVG